MIIEMIVMTFMYQFAAAPRILMRRRKWPTVTGAGDLRGTAVAHLKRRADSPSAHGKLPLGRSSSTFRGAVYSSLPHHYLSAS
jgi:hypothetical protein